MATSKKAIYAAIAGNGAVAVVKFIAAAMTGSAAMLSEGIHSVVDTGNGGLLLVGIRKSQKPADNVHPFGHGKELYFYTLIVAILIFAVGGGISIYEGILHVQHSLAHPGEPMGDPLINYIVLGLAIIFEGGALYVATKEFLELKGADESFMQAIRTSKDPTTFTVLFEDTAAILGLIVALVGIFLAHTLQMPVLDGAASIVIGVILCGVAVMLAVESKGLLVGERADPKIEADVRRIILEQEHIEKVVRLLSLHMGPHDVVLNLEVTFNDQLSTPEMEAVVDQLEEAVRTEHPQVKYIFVEAESVVMRRQA